MRNDGERQILSLLPKDGRHCNTARFGATRDVVFSCCVVAVRPLFVAHPRPLGPPPLF